MKYFEKSFAKITNNLEASHKDWSNFEIIDSWVNMDSYKFESY